MSINYFCSGFDKENAFQGMLGEYLKKDLVTTKRIIYIPASNKEEKVKRVMEEKIPMFKEHFRKIGIIFEEEICITKDTPIEEAKLLVKDSDMVMLMGGNPFHQKELLEEKELIDILKNYNGVILGFSAGAMNMSKYIIITPCSEEYPDFDIREGLILSNISIYPHINFEGEIFPEKIIMGDEITVSKDLQTVSEKYGIFYCLQDVEKELGMTKVSLIRTTKEEMNFINYNEGKVWEVTKDTFNIVYR